MKNKKTLSRLIVEGMLFYTGDGVIGKLLGVVSVFILISYLGVFEYGLWILSKSVFDVFNNFFGMGIGPTVLADMNVERGKKNYSKLKAIFLDFVKVRFTLSILSWFIIFFSADLIGSYYSNAVIPHVKTFSFLLLISPFKSVISIFFKSYLKFNYIVFWSILEKVLFLIFVFIFVFILDLGVNGAILSLVFATLISSLVLSPFFIRIFRHLSNIDRDNTNYIWKIGRLHGKWAIFSNQISTIDKNIYSCMVAYFLGVESVAIFSIAKSLLNHLSSLVPVSKVISPIFPLELLDRSKIKELFFRSFKYSFYILVLFSLAAYFLVPIFIEIFFPQYVESIQLFNIILITLIVSSIASLLNPLFNALKMQKELFYYILIKFVVSITLATVLIYYLGLVGVAINFVAISMLFTLMRYYGLKKVFPEVKINFRNLFVFDDMDKILLSKIRSRFKVKQE